jgi:Ner family transcriptional regulator
MVRHKPASQEPAQDWHKADIKAALEKRGWSLRSLAKRHGLSHTTLAQALRSSYPACEKRIAEALDLHPMNIWPSRYNKDGTPNGQRGNPKWIAQGQRSTAASVVNVKSARAR